ncbi:MAG: T9SS type A sorting domain-containing protein [Bacteroidetes bacterium]|nr:MAG: T9SS type A sorting domain-containing protein [Bacteroidota bacterium]
MRIHLLCFSLLVSFVFAPVVSAQTFRKTYGGPGDDQAHDIIPSGTGYLIAGSTTSFSNGGTDAMLVKVDPEGNQIWQRHYGSVGNEVFRFVVPTADDGYLAFGEARPPGFNTSNLIVVKTNAQGVVLWSQIWNNNFNEQATALTASPDGFLLSGLRTNGGSVRTVMIYLDANGNQVWSKVYTNSVNNLLRAQYISGNVAYVSGAVDDHACFAKIDLLDGSVFGEKRYLGTKTESLYHMRRLADGNFIMSDGTWSTSGGVKLHHWVQKVTPDGSVLWSRTYEVAARNIRGNIEVAQDGGFILTTRDNLYDAQSKATLIRLSATGALEWAFDYDGAYHDRLIRTIVTADGGFLSIGYTRSNSGGGNDDILLLKTDATGEVPACDPETPTVNEINFEPAVFNAAVNENPYVGPLQQSVPFGQFDNFPLTGFCGDCPDTTFTVEVFLCPGDSLQLGGVFYAAPAVVLDTLFSQTGCDSVFEYRIMPYPAPPVLDLGPSVFICPGTALALDAGSGYASYLWNTGSMIQLLVASAAGTYWVEVQDVCGQVQRDTVVIETLSIPAIQLPDTSICIGGAFTLHVPGFSTYTWAPAQGLSCTDCATVTVQPATTTNYTLTVTTDDGCVRTDAFLVTVAMPGPVLDLGPDLLLCPGSMAVVDAGPGYVTYEWQDGSTDRMFSVSGSGVFWVEVTDSCGLVQRDTVVVQEENVPGISLPDTSLCVGEAFSLDIAGFSTYSWAPASGLSCTDCPVVLVQPNNTTLYTLEAATSNGCVQRDTFQVQVFSPGPPLDLGPAVILCTDSTVVFDAGPGYAAYLWQDSSDAPVFSTSASGIYWVEVTDSCGLIQRDSVLLTVSLVGDIKLVDTSMCVGDSLLISVPDFDEYNWSPVTGLNCSDCATVILQPDITTIYTLEATTTLGCVKNDTFQVQVFTPGPVLDLGPDVILCDDSTVIFDAGPGYLSYLWSDGSTSRTFAAASSGIYSVVVADSCGRVQQDTVLLTVSLIGDIKLADTSICFGDSLLISVPGFDVYSWMPAFGLSCTNCETVTLQPDITTLYTLEAITSLGCIKRDTFQVQVFTPGPLLDLGPDVVLCSDTTKVFDAGPGYRSYSWQDGTSAQTITASSTGVYWVEVTDSCGTVQRDSVLHTVSLIGDLQLADTSLCAGDSYLVGAPGFDGYSWSPAAGLSCTDCSNVVIQPDSATVYTLVASTSDGCTRVDTFSVDVIPLETILDTLEFCPGDTIVLDGVPYTQPGVYTDTIPVAGSCPLVKIHYLYPATSPTASVFIECMEDINIATVAGTGPVVVHYDLPDVFSDCPCPDVQLTLVKGLPSGSLFPETKTEVCYQATDYCGNVDSCCFSVIVREALPCDAKEVGCMRYELLRITKDSMQELTYSFRVVNKCPDPMVYAVFQLPQGSAATAPANNSIYTAPGNIGYEVRNPSLVPFYSIRFKSTTDSIANNEAAIFRYTVPQQNKPDYIRVSARLVPAQFPEAYLNTFNCPVQQVQKPVQIKRSSPGVLVFPNPASDKIFINLAEWDGTEVQVRILDVAGRVVHQSQRFPEVALQEIPLGVAWRNGLYLLEVRSEAGRQEVVRFVVQR